MGETKVSMKLLIDTRGERVLFAEAGKDCVDFLFYLLSLPLSTVTRLLGEQGMVGPMGNLYESIESLKDCYIQPNGSKDALLKPALGPMSDYSVPLLPLEDSHMAVKKFYRCSNCGGYSVSDNPRALCPNCRYVMTREIPYVAPPEVVKKASGEEGVGFVKGVVTYMIMDDLVVKPMSTISSITLLNKFNVKDVVLWRKRR